MAALIAVASDGGVWLNGDNVASIVCNIEHRDAVEKIGGILNYHDDLTAALRRFCNLCENWGSGKQLTATPAYTEAIALLSKVEGRK